MENEPAAKANDRQIDETIAQDCQVNTSSDGDGEAGAIPTELGRYEIDRLLGRGGMGSVYLANDTNLQREVALKVPTFSLETNPKLIDRFYREARSAANLSHPNLCPVFDVGEIDGTHYIAMAYIKGRPLSDYVQSDKTPESRVAATIIRKVAIAMEDAHKSGILHRDLKPANIMIDHRKEPIVMDFGLACPQDIGNDTRLTREGTLLGSPAYMPPEQLIGRTELIGPASDVYSLGVVLYEFLTGRLPFDGVDSTIALIGRILSEPPKDLLEVRPEVDADLAKICRKAMAKEVPERYATMEAFANDLTLYLRSSTKGSGGKEAVRNDAGGQDHSSDLAEPEVSPDPKKIQLQEQTKLVKTLCKTGQIEAASQLLQEIVVNPDAQDSETGRWAAAMIPKVQSRLTQPPPTATESEPSRKPKWIVPATIVVASLCVAGLGSFLWYARDPAPTPEVVVTPDEPSAVSDLSATERREKGRRGSVRPRLNESDSPRRRDPTVRFEELMELKRDSDGRVSLSRLSDAQRRRFWFIDGNDDGFLDEAEIEELERRRARPQEGLNDRPGPPGPFGERPFPRGGPPNEGRGRE